MLLTYFVDIKIGHKQKKYYESLGYDVKNCKENITVNIKDITKGSRVKVKVKCDYCDTEKEITFDRYNVNTANESKPYACSVKCSVEKAKLTTLERYGKENVSQNEEIKLKKIETCLKNHGVEHPQQNKDVFEKSKNAKLLKYNDENYNNSSKMRETCLEIYGNEYPQKTEQVKKKTKLSQFNYFKEIILEKYKYLNIIDYDIDDKYILNCDCGKEHTFSIKYKMLWNRLNRKTILCTECNKIDYGSGVEKQLLNFITENYNDEIIFNTKKVISPLELDIYLTKLNIAFEFNGLYWHNEINKDKNYHKLKSDMCNDKGIQLIHIWEDDWCYKQDIVKSMILNKLKLIKNNIYARKCILKEVSSKESILFLENNHIQGKLNSKIRIGLYYNDELVSLMCLGKKRLALGNKSDGLELLRFCNKINTNVIGGASKIFNYIIKNIEFNDILTYADRSYSNGNLYNVLGFKYVGTTEPNYYYIIDGIREYRFNHRKEKLIKLGYDSNLSEQKIMFERGIFRIYNAGNLKYIYNR